MTSSFQGLREHARRLSGRAVGRTARRSRQRGQGLTEFALVLPIMFLLVIAIADFGRLFTTMVGVEAAAREGADYGAFLGSDAWVSTNSPWSANDTEIRRRVCSATSQLTGFTNTSGTCSQNPTVSWEVLTRDATNQPYHVVNPARVQDECGGRLGLVDPCVVHVTVSFTFTTILPIPPIPSSVTILRQSWFAVSDLNGT